MQGRSTSEFKEGLINWQALLACLLTKYLTCCLIFVL